jgi:hypothetical protein
MANSHLEPNDGNVKRAKSKRSKRSDQKPISTFRQRDDWIGRMLAVDNEALSPAAKVLATRVALHLNINKGQCYPSVPTLAKGTGLCERYVYTLLADLERTGWLAITRSHGRSNSFLLRTPEPLNNSAGVGSPEPLNPSAGVGTPEPQCRGPLNPSSPKQRSNSESGRGSAPRPARAGAGGGIRPVGKDLVLVRDDGSFEALRAAWPRPWVDDDAADRRAFMQAQRHAPVEDIIAGAPPWVEAMEARYLPALAKWLAARGWEKPPPRKFKPPKPRGNGGKVDLVRMGLKQEAGYVEDDDGNLFRPDDGRLQ